MPMNYLIQKSAFSSSETRDLGEAFDKVCRELNLKHDDPLREVVARKVIEFAESRTTDQKLVRVFVLAAMQGLCRYRRCISRKPQAEITI